MRADFFGLLCKKDVKHSLWRVGKKIHLDTLSIKDTLQRWIEDYLGRKGWNNSSHANFQGILKWVFKT